MKPERRALWEYVEQTRRMLMVHDPQVFSPAGARETYAWSLLPLRLHQGPHVEPARAAALDLTADPRLRTIYGGPRNAGGGRYLDTQLQNLARRSMMFAIDDQSFRYAFRYWYPRFVRWLNQRTITAFTATELDHLELANIARKAGLRRLPSWPGESGSMWIEAGDLLQFANKHRILPPPEMWKLNVRNEDERARAVAVQIRSIEKDETGIHGFSTGESAGRYFLRAIQLIAGRQVEGRTTISGELGSFPTSYPFFYESTGFRMRDKRRRVVLDTSLIRAARDLEPDLEDLGRARVRLDNTAVGYAEAIYWRLITEPGAWFDDVVSAASAIESLFGTEGQRTELSHRVAQRAAWLASADESERSELYRRLRELYAVRSQILHAGMANQRALQKILRGFGTDPPTVASSPESRLADELIDHWGAIAFPRLLSLVRWAVLSAVRLARQPSDSPVGWPVTSGTSRDIDADILHGRRRSEWHRVLANRVASPFSSG